MPENIRNAIRRHDGAGPVIQAGDARLTPQSQAFSVRWRGGGFVWNRPVAVVVERNGRVARLPIVDTTRRIQLALLGAAALFTFLGATRRSRSDG